MSKKPQYVQGYAVVRIEDRPPHHPASVGESMIDGVAGPAPGPWNVTVKEIVMTVEEARREVVRLNALNDEQRRRIAGTSASATSQMAG
jgi:hypothetical protein